jgi:hypothetical protein
MVKVVESAYIGLAGHYDIIMTPTMMTSPEKSAVLAGVVMEQLV